MPKLVPNAIWNYVQEQLAELRADLLRERERCDRLTEALARKAEVPLYMPAASTPEQLTQVLEKSAGWFDSRPVPAVTSKTPGETRQ